MFSTESYRPRRASNISILSSNAASQSSQFTPQKDPKNGQSYAQLRCQVKQEDVKVNWLRDEHEITQEMDKYKILENGRERILEVNDVQNDDAGWLLNLNFHKNSIFLLSLIKL